MYHVIEQIEPFMPKEKIRYLMGVGTPSNIIEGVWRGVDLFDCVMPSRNARHGHIFTWNGIINLNNAKYQSDSSPIEEGCSCPVCQNYSRAYIRHLLKAGEMLGMRLAVQHNLYFYNTLMEQIRAALDDGRFAQFRDEYSVQPFQKNLSFEFSLVFKRFPLARLSLFVYNKSYVFESSKR